MVQKIYPKMNLVSCNNTHHDVTNLVNQGMVKNTKTWISRERNITFLQNKKKIITRASNDTFLRSYCFLAEVTFNNKHLGRGNQQGFFCLFQAPKCHFSYHIRWQLLFWNIFLRYLFFNGHVAKWLANEGFLVWAWLPAMCTGELSVVIIHLTSKCLSRVESGRKELWKWPPLPMLSCDSWMLRK